MNLLDNINIFLGKKIFNNLNLFTYNLFNFFYKLLIVKERPDYIKNWIKTIESLGAGEIIINSIDKDGSLEGYDYEISNMISNNINIPVLLSGGGGKWRDFVDAVKIGKADGVCTSNIYHFTETSIRSAKKFMFKNKIQVRI